MKTKKLLAAFLSAAMVITTTAVSVLAEEDKPIVVDVDTRQTINLSGQTIQGTEGAGITVNAGAELNLVLEGENSVTGAGGFAGIYVAPGATLTISGSGSLTVKGGDGCVINKNKVQPYEGMWYYGGGAGIGGNGVAYVTNIAPNRNEGDPSFGTINIESGTITAIGGGHASSVGYGAGIGGGGNRNNHVTPAGNITISGGNITATGGGIDEESNGGSGIGSGGRGSGGTGGGGVSQLSNINISITGGEVNAIGAPSAAGIGGGSNVSSGDISILGGKVTATGGAEGGTSDYDKSVGGAGIGGGDEGEANGNIIIAGNAEVTATAGGSAAGIGGGHGGGSTSIEIKDNAKVTAKGGSTSSTGGAGIGGGQYSYSEEFTYQFGNIVIDGEADVTAVGGKNAHGIGCGSNSANPVNGSVEIGPDANVKAAAPDSDKPAIWGVEKPEPGQDPSEVFGSKAVIWYDEDCTPGHAHYWDGETLLENYFDWTYEKTSESEMGMIKITKDRKLVTEFAFPANPDGDVKEWAVTYVKPYATAVKIEFAEVEDKSGTYEIYAAATSADEDKFEDSVINRLLSADLTFTNSNDNIAYTIAGAENIDVIDAGEGRYEFNYNGTEADSGAPKSKVLLGTVTFSGYGTTTFGVNFVTTNIVNTAKKADNIVDHYVPDGVVDEKSGKLTYDEPFTYTHNVSEKAVKVNVMFPNKLADEPKNMDMAVTVKGGNELDEDGNIKPFETTIPLADKELEPFDYTNPGSESEVENANGYKLTVNVPVPDGIGNRFTFTFSGLGYRTYSVDAVIESDDVDPSVTVWNNVMDEAVAVVKDDADSATVTTFLAGDIVMDNTINLYDLSAVVAYFGKTNADTEAYKDYIKYDLNRDGAIDSKDIAMVLVSWGY